MRVGDCDGPTAARLSRLSQDREALARLVEEDEAEGCIASILARHSSGRLDGAEMCGFEAEEDLDGRGASKALMGAEAEVVEESDFDPSLQVVDGEGDLEPAESGHLLE